MGDGHVGKAYDTVDNLVQGPVPAAGIDAQRFPGCCSLPGPGGEIPRLPGDQNLVVQILAGGGNPGLVFPGPVFFTCGGIDKEEVPHFRLPPRYM